MIQGANFLKVLIILVLVCLDNNISARKKKKGKDTNVFTSKIVSNINQLTSDF